MAPWADVLYGCDERWWREYFVEADRAFRGEMWTINENARDRFGLNWIRGGPIDGLSRAHDSIRTGRNSGFQAICLAYLFGAVRILLLGYDFQRTDGRSHWHGNHPRGLGNGGSFPRWCETMTTLAAELEQEAIEVYNCTRQTALTCFRRCALESVL
ncbi:MAG: hypothetical protein H0W33_02555 [Gammaproteobacteria bacterium]|nr:hypothetical protein [Gammaproteobacteria bacterium]